MQVCDEIVDDKHADVRDLSIFLNILDVIPVVVHELFLLIRFVDK